MIRRNISISALILISAAVRSPICFTHWIDVVHMFLEQDNPIAANASGGVYHYKDGRTAPDTIAASTRVPGRMDRDL